MMLFLLLILTVLSLAGAAFCAGAETAFLSVSRERVLHLSREGGRKARKVEKALTDMGRTMTTLLIGNNLATVAYSSATAAISVRLFSDQPTASAIWSFFAAFTVLYVSEFMPKMLCAARPLRHALRLADVYDRLAKFFSPLVTLTVKAVNIFLPGREVKYRFTAADLVRILQDRKDGVCLSDFESALISRIVVLRAKGRPVTAESLVSALRDVEPKHAT